MRGLISAESTQLDSLGQDSHVFYEVVVGASDLLGRTLKEVGFRGRYSAAVLAIHRQGRPVEAKLGEVRLHMGDTLLVLADQAFRERWRDSRDFLLISPLTGALPPQRPNAWKVGVIGLAFVVLTGLGILPLLNAALLTGLALVATRAINIGEARRAIDLNLVLLIAASFGLGAAVQSSGLATVMADVLLAVFNNFGPIGALAGILLATIALTEVISHNAAAVLLFPVAIATAASLGSPAAALRARRAVRGEPVVPDPGRISDQPDGLQPGQLPVPGLPPPGRAADRRGWRRRPHPAADLLPLPAGVRDASWRAARNERPEGTRKVRRAVA